MSNLAFSVHVDLATLVVSRFAVCEISDLLLFVSHFASQSKGIKFGDYLFDVRCINENFLVRCQIPTTCYSTGITVITEKHRT